MMDQLDFKNFINKLYLSYFLINIINKYNIIKLIYIKKLLLNINY